MAKPNLRDEPFRPPVGRPRSSPKILRKEPQLRPVRSLRSGSSFDEYMLVNIVTSFEFYRFRFHFRALDQVHFPPGKSANVVRGAFGTVLRDAVPPSVYSRLFEPGTSLGAAPSGLADW